MKILPCLIGIVLAQAAWSAAVTIETSGAGNRYLACDGKPLLAFGPGDESRLISRDDPDAVRRWAKWQQSNGMNLLRAYPTSVPGASNWRPDSSIPLPPAKALHPFNRKGDKWDVDSWNDEYFKNMSRFFGLLDEYGIVVHLQLWQIVWFKEDGPDRWAANYVNPANNVNEWTRAYPRGVQYMNAPSDSPAGKHRREWVRRVLGAVKGHPNVWIDVINELENAGVGNMDWAHEVVTWIRDWERANGRRLIVGVDMCNFSADKFRPYAKDYDLLIFNELHRDQALAAAREFGKPVVTVRSSDGSNNRADYLFLDPASTSPAHQTRYRTLCYRSIFSGVQSIGAYWKPEVSDADYAAMTDWPKYSRALRKFWRTIEPFRADLAVDDSIVSGAVTPRAYGLRSDRLVAAYLECGPNAGGKKYPASEVTIACPFERYRVEIFEPRTGRSRLASGKSANGRVSVSLPAFTEDLVILIRAPGG